jgi:hypothetical protein
MCHAGMCGVLFPSQFFNQTLTRCGQLGPRRWFSGCFFFFKNRNVLHSEGKFENKVVIEAFQGGSRPWREVIRRPLNLE